MTAELNWKAYDFARDLVADKKVAIDERDARSEHNLPRSRRMTSYACMAMTNTPSGTWASTRKNLKTARPGTSFLMATSRHRCAVISVESRAGQYKHYDIEKAAHNLHEMIDELKNKRQRARASA